MIVRTYLSPGRFNETDLPGLRRECANPGKVRHLLFHLWPVRDGHWRWHAEQLKARASLFNGKKFLAVVTDGVTDTVDTVKDAFGGFFDEVLTFTNDPSKREVLTFEPLFRCLEGIPDDHAFLWAHAKGANSVKNFTAIKQWAQALYTTYCDHWPVVEKLLQTHPLAVALKKVGGGWPQHESSSDWHPSGSWCWYRGDHFKRPHWNRIEPFFSGIESYPSMHYTSGEAGCIFHERPVPQMNLYEQSYWDDVLQDALTLWDIDQKSPPPDGLKVELGGGNEYALGGEWINVDRDAGPMVKRVVDFEQLGYGSRLPFEDDTVAHIYSSHCFEHVSNLKGLLHEVTRIAKVGARVEVRVPHWLDQMAMCYDHKQVIPPRQVDQWTIYAIPFWWKGCKKRLKHLHMTYGRNGKFDEVKALHPGWSDRQLYEYAPGASHECRYLFEVIPNE